MIGSYMSGESCDNTKPHDNAITASAVRHKRGTQLL